MSNFQDSFLSGGNIEFIEGLYARYLEDPSSVDPSWREVFERNTGGKPIFVDGPAKNGNGNGHAAAAAPTLQAPAAQHPDVVSTKSMGLQSRADQTVYAFRLRGHLLAKLDPLGRPRPPLSHYADIAMVNDRHFSEEELRQVVDATDVLPEKRVPLRTLLDRLRQTYCHHIGVEYMTLLDSDRRRWLMPRMEHSANRTDFSVDDQRRILTKLSYAEGFEQFLHTKYIGAKRFSIDGGESMIPMLDAFLEVGGTLGVREVVIGMAHRGRLNVLTNILGKSPDEIFSEFEGGYDAKSLMHRGDVKYHQGFSSDYETEGGGKIHLSLAFNPSHLEAVDPVVLGRVRCKQDRYKDVNEARKQVVPVLIHGDAAFAGQGVVAETLNLSRLRGYDVGGTIHLVINNQVGFTTDPSDARSTIYCTAMAQMLDIPIFHVNADDPEACVHVMRLAAEYRQKFKSDVVVDLVCYRRYGHNEADEPSFTQPGMYALIKKQPTVRQLYAQQLAEKGRIPAAESEKIRSETMQDFSEAHARAKEKSRFREPSAMQGLWSDYRGGLDREVPQIDTGVAREKLVEVLEAITRVPEGFKPHATLERFLSNRRAMIDGAPLDWSAGETLAYATLLAEGHTIRLTGQDVERGTFTHRHAVLHDVNTGARYVPVQSVAQKGAELRIFNSPLSEMGCLGFEYGYSLDAPDRLIIWEAQFGDFANNAQVIIDQFIVAGERKWSRLCGLTLLLPHGYEGQGPEHSSARLERFLELCANDNIQVCYPTTPAQMFHLLRRQMLRKIRKPLVVMSPKSLLRKPEATSPLEDLTRGGFRRVIADGANDGAEVTRLLLCSGKVYYDLAAEREKRKDRSVAIARLEQLYPFPDAEVIEILDGLPKLKEVFWVQEEPKNMGAWRYIIPHLNELVTPRVKSASFSYVGRVEAASPATGFEKAHKLEQQMIVDQALSRGSK